MSRASSAFSAAFGQTLMQGMKYQQQREQERQELEIRKKLADAQFAYHQAQTADLQQKMKAQADFLAKVGRSGTPAQPIMQQDPMGEGQFQVGETPAQPGGPSREDMMGYEASQGRSVAPFLKQPTEQFPYQATEAGILHKGTGEFRPHAPQKDPLQDQLRQGMLSAMGGGAQSQGQPATGPQAAPQGGPATQYGAPEYHLDAKGRVTATVKPEKNTVEYRPEMVNGQPAVVKYVNDPAGRGVAKEVVGAPITPTEMQMAGRIAESFGFRPGTPEHATATNDIIAAEKVSPQERSFLYSQIRQRAQGGAAAPAAAPKAGGAAPGGASGAGGSAPAPTGGDPFAAARGAAQQEEISTAARKTAATTRARVENEPPDAARQKEINTVKALARTAQRLDENFRPEFVGKGFQADRARKEFDKLEATTPHGSGKYSPGAAFGWLREKTGNISDQEATFRRDIADTLDQMLRLRSGAAITPAEYDRLKDSLFTLWNEPNVFKARLAVFRSDLAAAEADMYSTGMRSNAQGAREAESRRGPVNPVRPQGRPEMPGAPINTSPKILKIVPLPAGR